MLEIEKTFLETRKARRMPAGWHG